MPADRQADVVSYTLPFCVHCARARTLLGRRGIAFREIDGAGTPFRRILAELTGGLTVPQTVIDGHPVGGADQLARLDRLGVLAALIKREPFPIAARRRRLSARSLEHWLRAALSRHRRESLLETRVVWLDRDGRAVPSPRESAAAERST